MEEIKNKRVIVAMSGGIDSSVAAALLKRGSCPELGRRVDVIGVFMKFWSPLRGSTQIYTDKKTDLHRFGNRCCSSESEKRARLVAEKLGIPFYVFDFSKEFKKKVVDYFLKEEKAGLTPNPCVVCNKEIKFGLLLEKVLTLNADFVATGHYARVRKKFVNSKQIRYSLISGKDKNKDQSYFLWKLNQKILKRTLFPVGDYTKTEVRSLAKRFKLPVLNIPESQEICFIQTNIADFLRKYLKAKPGKIINSEGKILGEHQGLWFYTIGQRKGLKLSESCRCQTSASLRMSDIYRNDIYRNRNAKPFYVLGKDTKRNFLIVTQNEKDLFSNELIMKNINWVSKVKFPLKAMAKIRYRHKPGSAVVNKNKVVFVKPQKAITPGQSVVFYKGQQLLGGGVIL